MKVLKKEIGLNFLKSIKARLSGRITPSIARLACTKADALHMILSPDILNLLMCIEDKHLTPCSQDFSESRTSNNDL